MRGFKFKLSWNFNGGYSIQSIFISPQTSQNSSQHNDKNYIDGEKRAYRTSEQLTETHSQRNWQNDIAT
jgi:hypothetical protein